MEINLTIKSSQLGLTAEQVPVPVSVCIQLTETTPASQSPPLSETVGERKILMSDLHNFFSLLCKFL